MYGHNETVSHKSKISAENGFIKLQGKITQKSTGNSNILYSWKLFLQLKCSNIMFQPYSAS